jgi:hypothetical protein
LKLVTKTALAITAAAVATAILSPLANAATTTDHHYAAPRADVDDNPEVIGDRSFFGTAISTGVDGAVRIVESIFGSGSRPSSARRDG